MPAANTDGKMSDAPPSPVSHSNVDMIRQVAMRLGPDLLSQVVFVGGATIALYLTDPAAPPVRPTLDVDVIIETPGRGAYYRITDALRAQNFREDPPTLAWDEPPIVCRWRVDDLIVDVMPTDEAILGFSNRWYSEAYRTAILFTLPSATVNEASAKRAVTDAPMSVRLVTAPYALATKIEAFRGRGRNDLFGSRDIEDIVTLIDGRAELAEEMRSNTTPALQSFTAEFFLQLLNAPRLSDAVEEHLTSDASGSRATLVIQRMQTLSRLVSDLK